MNLLLDEMYSQSLLKCFIIIFRSIQETRTQTNDFSFHCSEEACQQLSELAYCSLLRELTEVGRKPENCFTFLSPKDVKRTVSRDLLKICEFCKMFWIANNS